MVRVVVLAALLGVSACADFNDGTTFVRNQQPLQQNLPSNREPEPRGSMPP